MSKIIYLLSFYFLLTCSPGFLKAAEFGIYTSADSGTGLSVVGAPVLNTSNGTIFVASPDAKAAFLRGNGSITTNCIWTNGNGDNIDIL